jgi:Aromatic-ring hydroxylase, C-terminal
MILFPMRGHRWRLTLPFADDGSRQDPTLATTLRGGRHVLVVTAAHTAVLSDAALRPFRADLDVVTADSAAGPVILVRPDGHVAARGRPGRMEAVTRYLRDLFSEPPGHSGESQRRGTAGSRRETHSVR